MYKPLYIDTFTSTNPYSKSFWLKWKTWSNVLRLCDGETTWSATMGEVFRLIGKLDSAIAATNLLFGNIIDPEFENDTHIFNENFMATMRTHNLRMTPIVHDLVLHVPKYVCRTGVPGLLLSRHWRVSISFFDTFYHPSSTSKCLLSWVTNPWVGDEKPIVATAR